MVFASPAVPGARPANSSEASALVCCDSAAAEIESFPPSGAALATVQPHSKNTDAVFVFMRHLYTGQPGLSRRQSLRGVENVPAGATAFGVFRTFIYLLEWMLAERALRDAAVRGTTQ